MAKKSAAAAGSSVESMIAAVNAAGEQSQAAAQENGLNSDVGVPGSMPSGLQTRRPRKKLSEQWREEEAASGGPAPTETQKDLSSVDVEAQFMGPNAELASQVDDEQPVESEIEAGGEQYPDYLLQSALQLGLDKSDYANPQALARAVMREAERNRNVQQYAPQQAQQPVAEKAVELNPFEGIDVDMLDDDTKTALKGVFNNALKTIEQRLAPIAQVTQQNQQFAAQQRDREIDNAFAGLNKKFNGVFGEQSINALHPNSAERAARMQVIATAAQFAQTTGRPVEEYLERCARVIFGETAEAVEKNVGNQKILTKLQGRQSQMLGAPTHREKAALSPREEGVEMVRKFLNTNGHHQPALS